MTKKSPCQGTGPLRGPWVVINNGETRVFRHPNHNSKDILLSHCTSHRPHPYQPVQGAIGKVWCEHPTNSFLWTCLDSELWVGPLNHLNSISISGPLLKSPGKISNIPGAYQELQNLHVAKQSTKTSFTSGPCTAYLDPGCPSFLGVMSHKFVGYTPKKVGHPGSR